MSRGHCNLLNARIGKNTTKQNESNDLRRAVVQCAHGYQPPLFDGLPISSLRQKAERFLVIVSKGPNPDQLLEQFGGVAFRSIDRICRSSHGDSFDHGWIARIEERAIPIWIAADAPDCLSTMNTLFPSRS